MNFLIRFTLPDSCFYYDNQDKRVLIPFIKLYHWFLSPQRYYN
jgi:hypothetical protein